MFDLIDGKESNITKVVNGIGFYITKIINKVENTQNYWIEICVMVMYAIMHFLLSFFHEPWFDEAEAWQIARAASIKEILFEIPHLEGHSPMWNFILMPWARLGVPYELSLSIVTFLFMGTAVGLIIWKSPFPRIIRLILPFTYFFMYQYGVICRPYCVITLLLMILAYMYPTKDEKAWIYISLLAVLANIHIFGLLLSGGLACIWLSDNIIKNGFKSGVKALISDVHLLELVFLLAVAVITIIQIWPYSDTYGIGHSDVRNNILVRMLYTFVALPAEVGVTDVWHDYRGLDGTQFVLQDFITACFVGVLIWGLLIWWGKKKKTLRLLIVPYVFLASFAGCVYFSMHHMGVILMFFVYWAWVSEQTSESRKHEYKNSDSLIVNAYVLFGFFCISISVFWTIMAGITDIKYIYAYGREEAKFIQENKLEDMAIMSEWETLKDKNDGTVIYNDFNVCCNACNILPYFDSNIIINLNEGFDDKAYVQHKVNDSEEDKAFIDSMKNINPELLLGEPELELVYKDVSIEEYSLIYYKVGVRPWKNGTGNIKNKIYIRNDLVDKCYKGQILEVK